MRLTRLLKCAIVRRQYDSTSEEKTGRGMPRGQKINWLPEHIRLFGTDTDLRVAKQIGLSPFAVTGKRKSLCIPAFRPRPKSELAAERVAKLGTAPDRVLAEQWGLTAAVVRSKRIRMRIPAFRQSPAPIQWTESMLRCLGEDTDDSVAEQLGLSVTAIAVKRRSMGIPSFGQGGPQNIGFHWGNAEIGLLRKFFNASVARKLGISVEAVRMERARRGIPNLAGKKFRRRQWTEKELALIGTGKDQDIARKLGCSANTVLKKRHELGRKSQRTEIAAFTATMDGLLGRYPDAFLARCWHLTRTQVAWRRHALKIPPWGGRTEWSAQMLSELGMMTNPDFSRKFSVPLGRVRIKRAQLGTAPFQPRPKRHVWRKSALALLGTMPDSALSEKLGIPTLAVCRKRNKLGIRPFREAKQR